MKLSHLAIDQHFISAVLFKRIRFLPTKYICLFSNVLFGDAHYFFQSLWKVFNIVEFDGFIRKIFSHLKQSLDFVCMLFSSFLLITYLWYSNSVL